MESCKNCGETTTGIYCSYCGQKVILERISFHHLWHGLLHFFTHAEKGFFYTSVQLIVKPGLVVKKFIDGSRLNYQTPVSYFLIWNAAYILLLYFTNKIFGENVAVNFAGYFGAGEKTSFAISHLNIVLLALLPIQALYVWFLLMYRRFNYFEAFVVVLYSIGTLMLWQCVFILLGVLFHLISGMSVNIRFSDIFKMVYVGWFLLDFCKLLEIKQKNVKAVVLLLLIGATFTAWRLYIYPSVAELFF